METMELKLKRLEVRIDEIQAKLDAILRILSNQG